MSLKVNNYNDVKPGSIYRIYLKNFLTYNEVELYPGTSLNLIIGPNGAGKSTFFCAIILGLAGETSVTGRIKEVHKYVKNGTDEAIIEIELYQSNGENNIIIKRTLIKSRMATTWSINNVEVNEAKVKECITRFNIQVDNLCQMLPQDKVHNVSKLDSHELLKSTLSAIAGQKYVNDLQTLVTSSKRKQDLKNRMTEILNQLNNCKDRNESLKGDVATLKEMAEVKKQIQICKSKELWIEYKEILQDVADLKSNIQNATILVEDSEKKLHSLSNITKKLETDKLKLERKLEQITRDDAKDAIKSQINAIKNKNDSIETINKEKLELWINKQNELDEARAERDSLIANKESRETQSGADQLEQVKQKLQKIERDIEFAEGQEQIKQQEVHSLRQQINVCKNNLPDLEVVYNKRLSTLQRYYKDTYEALKWYRNNKHLFEKPVHEPMMLLITFPDEKFGRYLEATVPARDLAAFTFESRSDMNEFLRRARGELRLHAVSAVSSGPDRPACSRVDISQLERLGFYAYLADKVSAPDAVLSYLCRIYGLARIPLGDDFTYDNADRVPPNVSCYFTESHKISVRRSAYSGQVARTTSELRAARLLAHGVQSAANDAAAGAATRLAALCEQKNTAEEELRAISSKLPTLYSEQSGLTATEARLASNISEIQRLTRLINDQNRRIDELASPRAREREEAALKMKLIEAVKQQCDQQQKLYGILKNCQEKCVKEQIIQIKLRKIREIINEKEAHRRQGQEKVNNDKEILNSLEHKLHELNKDAANNKKDVMRFCDNKMPGDEGFPYEEQFRSLPSNLTRHRHLLEAQKNALNPGDNQAISEYEKTQKEIEKLETELQRNNNDQSALQQSSAGLRELWVSYVKNLVEEINRSFSEMFASIDCAGEVRLDKGDTEDDFGKYGISIWVSFRAGQPVRRLSGTSQSGGERTLATALYLLAMQRSVAVPFRCVDEINQGVDSVNERSLFDLLIRETTGDRKSQYFLVTPKLLPNLKYNEHVVVHTIMNGKEIINHRDWNIERFLEAARSNRLQ